MAVETFRPVTEQVAQKAAQYDTALTDSVNLRKAIELNNGKPVVVQTESDDGETTLYHQIDTQFMRGQGDVLLAIREDIKTLDPEQGEAIIFNIEERHGAKRKQEENK